MSEENMKQHADEINYVLVRMEYDGEVVSFSPFHASLLQKLSGSAAIGEHNTCFCIDDAPVALTPLNERSGMLYIRLNHCDPHFFEVVNFVLSLLSPLVEGNGEILRIEKDSPVGVVVS